MIISFSSLVSTKTVTLMLELHPIFCVKTDYVKITSACD